MIKDITYKGNVYKLNYIETRRRELSNSSFVPYNYYINCQLVIFEINNQIVDYKNNYTTYAWEGSDNDNLIEKSKLCIDRYIIENNKKQNTPIEKFSKWDGNLDEMGDE